MVAVIGSTHRRSLGTRMQNFFVISFALCIGVLSISATETVAMDGHGKCVENDDCLLGIPEADQAPQPGTCCDFYMGLPEGTCVPQNKAKKCLPS